MNPPNYCRMETSLSVTFYPGTEIYNPTTNTWSAGELRLTR